MVCYVGLTYQRIKRNLVKNKAFKILILFHGDTMRPRRAGRECGIKIKIETGVQA